MYYLRRSVPLHMIRLESWIPWNGREERVDDEGAEHILSNVEYQMMEDYHNGNMNILPRYLSLADDSIRVDELPDMRQYPAVTVKFVASSNQMEDWPADPIWIYLV